MSERKFWGITFLFVVVIIMSQSAIPNHDYVPRTEDYAYHIALIVEAQRALLAGQWWLRTAPDFVHGLFYPVFQFYAPFAYTVAGSLGLLFSHNPLAPFTFTLGLCGLFGGWYAYKLYLYLFRNEAGALLGAVLYLFSPYLLIDLNVRGDFTEAISQYIFPVVLYYFFRLYHTNQWNRERLYFLLAAVAAYYCLMTCHILSLVSMSSFMFLLFIALAVQERNPVKLLPLVICILATLCLAAWYIIPIYLLKNILYITFLSKNGSPWGAAWITQLPTLLAPKALNTNPGHAYFALDPGIGLPLILTIGYWIYYKAQTPVVKTSFWLFLFAFFLAWSPFNFWQWLPHAAYIVQFPYRMLVNVSWLGGLLFVPMLNQLFKNALDQRHLMIGLFLILMANSQWLKDNYMNPTDPVFVHPGHPQFFFNLTLQDYLVDPQLIRTQPGPPPLTQCRIKNNISICQISQTKEQMIALPILYYPDLLKVTVNGKEVPYFPSTYPQKTGFCFATAAITLPPGSYQIKSQFTGLRWANCLSIATLGFLFFTALALVFSRKKVQKSKNGNA